MNINSTLPFTYAVATSSQYAFEFDNVAFNPTPASLVPEPSTSLVAIVGGAGDDRLQPAAAEGLEFHQLVGDMGSYLDAWENQDMTNKRTAVSTR